MAIGECRLGRGLDRRAIAGATPHEPVGDAAIVKPDHTVDVGAQPIPVSTGCGTYAGTWSSANSTSASAGRLRYATRAGASVSFRFTGRAVAVVAPKGPTRGSVKVYVDGVYAGAVSLYRTASVSRVVVFGRSWTASGTHTVKLVVVGTAGRPRVDIDGFAILR